MQQLRFRYRMELRFSQPVWRHNYALRCLPMHTGRQRPRDVRLAIEEGGRWTQSADGFGNLVVTGFAEPPHDRFGFLVTGEAAVDETVYDTDGASPLYAVPSPLTQPSAEIDAFLAARPFEGDGAARAVRRMHEVFAYFRYQPGVTGVQTTAAEAFALGRGVCQDYANVLMALLRREGVSVRYAAGLLLGEGATHAWVEVWTGAYWLPLDPTHDRPCGGGYLKLSHGRDFIDCAIDRGAFFGTAEQMQTVEAVVEAI